MITENNVSGYARSSSFNRGFTLIELLTVIAIIAILGAIMVPTIGKVRENANRASCASNVRQLGSAMFIFANDNGGKFPAMHGDNSSLYQIGTEFAELFVQGYNLPRDVFYCPSNPGWNRDEFWEATYTGVDGLVIGYCILAGNTVITDPNIDALDYPMSMSVESERKEMIVDIVAGRGNDWATRSGHTVKGEPAGGNVFFTDGSVSWRPFSEMSVGATGYATVYW